MENKNVKDIAKERTFANQTEQYNKEFAEWRADENNPYGYKYVHDKREHSYVVDEGYLKTESDVAERMALFKCLSLLGGCLIVMILICVLRDYFFSILYPGFSFGKVYINNSAGLNDGLTTGAAVALCVFDSAKFLIPAILFATITKIPKRVALPVRKNPTSVIASASAIILVAVVIGKICQYIVSGLFGFLGINTLYVMMYSGDSLGVQVVSFLTHCVILPISMEIFFRGVVLQTFRQFGDSFAIVVAAVSGSFVCFDITSMGYCAMMAFILSFFTVKTGSVKVAIIMNVVSSTANYILSLINIYGGDNSHFFEMVIFAFIVGIAVIGYSKLTSRIDWDFNLESDNTEMTFMQKVKSFFTTDTIMIWLVAGLLFILNGYRGA